MWTNASEVIVEDALVSRIGTFTRSRGTLHLRIARRIGDFAHLAEQVVGPKEREVYADAGCDLTGLSSGDGAITNADFGGSGLDGEVAREPRGAQVGSEGLERLLDFEGWGCRDGVSLGHMR